jgi:hypothetical protein
VVLYHGGSSLRMLGSTLCNGAPINCLELSVYPFV